MPVSSGRFGNVIEISFLRDFFFLRTVSDGEDNCVD